MHEPNISDGGRDEGFHRSHGEALDRPCGGEGPERLGLGSPETRDHEQDRRDDVYRPLPDLDSQGIADQTGYGDGDDAGALEAEGELLQGLVELLSEGREGGCEQWADRCVTVSVTRPYQLQ